MNQEADLLITVDVTRPGNAENHAAERVGVASEVTPDLLAEAIRRLGKQFEKGNTFDR
jgi:hypothetical protein